VLGGGNLEGVVIFSYNVAYLVNPVHSCACILVTVSLVEFSTISLVPQMLIYLPEAATTSQPARGVVRPA